MYELVADVESYPSFLPWCRAATVHARSAEEATATLQVARGPLRINFSTRNVMHTPERIELHLLDGPFRELEGTWRFTPLGEEGSKVSLHLAFEFSSGLVRATMAPIFRDIADTMLAAFCTRADQVHGRR